MSLFLFWFSLLLLIYTFVVYPLVMAAWARVVSRHCPRHLQQPAVSILVIAHNEAGRIAARIENLLALQYFGPLEIVIASDGSSDDTAALASDYTEAGVQTVVFAENRGKPAVLNELVPRLHGELVVLMDVRQQVAENALLELVADFADPAVGGVSGELYLASERTANAAARPGAEDGGGFYWRYEKAIRSRESLVDSTVGATGALYAFRRELFEPIPADTLLDDVLIPMQIARRGYRFVFEPRAIALEPVSTTAEQEYRRKIRTIAGNFQLFAVHAWLFNPITDRLWFQVVSHKFFRLLCPLLLLLTLCANLWLLDQPFYQAVFYLQILFYTVALSAHYNPVLRKRSRCFSVPHAFALLAWSTAVGFYRFCRGRQAVTWAHS